MAADAPMMTRCANRRLFAAIIRHAAMCVRLTKKLLHVLSWILKQLSLSDADRPVIAASKEKSAVSGVPVMAVMLENGKIVTGKQSNLIVRRLRQC